MWSDRALGGNRSAKTEPPAADGTLTRVRGELVLHIFTHQNL